MDEKAQDMVCANPHPERDPDLAHPAQPAQPAGVAHHPLDYDLCTDTHLAACEVCNTEAPVRVLLYGPQESTLAGMARRGKRVCGACFHAMTGRGQTDQNSPQP